MCNTQNSLLLNQHNGDGAPQNYVKKYRLINQSCFSALINCENSKHGITHNFHNILSTCNFCYCSVPILFSAAIFFTHSPPFGTNIFGPASLSEPNNGLLLHYNGSVSLQQNLMLSYVGIRLIHKPEFFSRYTLVDISHSEQVSNLCH